MVNRERTLSETEIKILDAALKVLNKETISGTRMHQIAEKADMVQSNIHYYYKTKEELLGGLQQYVVEECLKIRKKGRRKAGDSLADQIHIFFLQKKELLTRRKDLDFAEMDFIVQSKNNATIRASFAESYRNWREEIADILKRYCPEISEDEREELSYLIISLLEGASVQALIDRKEFDIGRYMDSAERFVLDHIEQLRRTKQ